MGDTVLDTLIPSHPNYTTAMDAVDLMGELVGTALPSLLAALAGPETAIEIGEDALRGVVALMPGLIDDLLAKVPVADVRKKLDDAVADILENLKFPQEPQTD